MGLWNLIAMSTKPLNNYESCIECGKLIIGSYKMCDNCAYEIEKVGEKFL